MASSRALKASEALSASRRAAGHCDCFDPVRINQEKPMLDRQSQGTTTGADASAGRSPTPGKIGFVGLGHMGTVMAANLAAAGCHVIGYVRRQELMDKVRGFGVTPTMDIAELFDCEAVTSML